MESPNNQYKKSLTRVNSWRQKNLPLFDQIYFTRQAMLLIDHLFLHPYCVNTKSFQKFTKQNKVSLKTLSRYILTAFPSTISLYANRRQKTEIDKKDIIECFSSDHVQDISDNKLEQRFSPTYVLAHSLTACEVKKIKNQNEGAFADLELSLTHKKIAFKNVSIPRGLIIHPQDKIFHHFGVIIDRVSNPSEKNLFQKVKNLQEKNNYLQKLKAGFRTDIDFATSFFYNQNLTQIISEKNKGNIFVPQIRIKKTKKSKVCFAK